MTSEEYLELADKLVGKDRFDIAHALLNVYHKGKSDGIQDLDKALKEIKQ